MEGSKPKQAGLAPRRIEVHLPPLVAAALRHLQAANRQLLGEKTVHEETISTLKHQFEERIAMLRDELQSHEEAVAAVVGQLARISASKHTVENLRDNVVFIQDQICDLESRRQTSEERGRAAQRRYDQEFAKLKRTMRFNRHHHDRDLAAQKQAHDEDMAAQKQAHDEDMAAQKKDHDEDMVALKGIVYDLQRAHLRNVLKDASLTAGVFVQFVRTAAVWAFWGEQGMRDKLHHQPLALMRKSHGDEDALKNMEAFLASHDLDWTTLANAEEVVSKCRNEVAHPFIDVEDVKAAMSVFRNANKTREAASLSKIRKFAAALFEAQLGEDMGLVLPRFDMRYGYPHWGAHA